MYKNLRSVFIKKYYWSRGFMFKLVQLMLIQNRKQLCNLRKYLKVIYSCDLAKLSSNIYVCYVDFTYNSVHVCRSTFRIVWSFFVYTLWLDMHCAVEPEVLNPINNTIRHTPLLTMNSAIFKIKPLNSPRLTVYRPVIVGYQAMVGWMWSNDVFLYLCGTYDSK